MHVIAIRPEADRGSGSGVVAYFDAQIAADIRMFGMALRRRADGSFVAYAPKNSRNCMCASFAPSLTAAITAAALAALPTTNDEGLTARGKSQAA